MLGAGERTRSGMAAPTSYEVNRSAPLEIEDATLPNVVLDINELCGIVDNGSAFRRDHKGEQ